jgi:hypothetical protein
MPTEEPIALESMRVEEAPLMIFTVRRLVLEVVA